MLILLLLLTGLSSCGFLLGGEKATPHTYLLSLDLSSDENPPGGIEGRAATLLVSLPRAQAGFDTPRMAYLLRPYEIRYYAHNRWTDTPARLLAPLVVEAMEETGCWHTVAQMPAAVRGDYRLDTEILNWQQEFFSQPSRVRLALRAQLVELGGQQVVAARRLEVLEDAPSEDAYGGVLASQRAVEKLLRQVSAWVQGLMEARGQPCR